MPKSQKGAWTLVTFIISDYQESKIFTNGLHKIGSNMSISAMGQLCQGKPVLFKCLILKSNLQS